MAPPQSALQMLLEQRRRTRGLLPQTNFAEESERFREMLKNDPRTKQQLSNILAESGWFISAQELQRIEDEPLEAPAEDLGIKVIRETERRMGGARPQGQVERRVSKISA